MKSERPAGTHAARLGAVAAAVLAVAPVTAFGQEVDLAVTAGIAYSDNVERVAVDETSDTIVSAGLQFGIAREGARLTTDASADLQYRHYLDDTYGDEVVGGLAATLVYAFVPDRFTWTVQENFGQTLEDRRFTETPDNRQNTNYFTTGPDWYIPIGGRTQLALQARWSDASFEDTSEADSQRYSAAIGLVRALSPTSSASLNATAESVDYDDALDTTDYDFDYDTVSGFLGYNTQGSVTTVELRAGYTTMDGYLRSYDGPLFDLNVTRQLTPRSSLAFNVGTNLTDAAEVFRRDQGLSGTDSGSGSVVVTPDPLQSEYAAVTLSLAGSRTTLQIGANWTNDEQENLTALDQERLGGSIAVTRQMSQRLEGRLFGAYSTEEIDVGADFDEWSFGGSLQWALSETFSLTLAADRTEGSGDTGAGEGSRDFTENRIALYLSYSPRR